MRCLRAPAIKTLVEAGDLQLSLFDERDLGEITSPDYPGERLVVCRNPLLADERTRKREALLAATETELARVAAMVERGTLRTAAAIVVRAWRVVDRNKMAKHVELDIADGHFAYRRKEEGIAAEGFPVHSFPTLLAELATLTHNRVVPAGADEAAAFELLSQPTPL